MTYALEPDATWFAQRAPEWAAGLRGEARVFRTGDEAPVLVGDPHDGIPIGVTTMTYGMPNPWALAKGRRNRMATVTRARVGDEVVRRCLVPATRVERQCARWTTLAGLSLRVEEFAGFAIAVERIDGNDVPLVVPFAEHEAWLDGWTSLDDAMRRAVPLAT